MSGEDRQRPDARREFLEDRLRSALAARAGAVGPHDLRRPSPPSLSVRGRFPVRGVALALFGLAAALACVFLLLPGEHGSERPAPPANPPVSHSDPPTPRTSAAPAPAPSAEAPSRTDPGTVPTARPAAGSASSAQESPADAGVPAAGPGGPAAPEEP